MAVNRKTVDEKPCVRHRTAVCGPRHGTATTAFLHGPTRCGGSGKALLPTRPGPTPPGAGGPLS